MADALRASCAAPVFKRPRLEIASCDSDTLISYESVSSEERFSVDSGLQEDVYEMTSSNECSADSAIQDISPISFADNNIHALSSHLKKQESSLEQAVTKDSENKCADNSSSDNISVPSELSTSKEPTGEQESTISEFTGLTELSNLSEDAEPNSACASWIQKQRTGGMDPRLILGEILPKGTFIPHHINDGMLWRYIINLLNEPRRTKLPNMNTLADAVHLLKTCKKIIVLTGAGVSVSCGIPDFRSRNGVYARLSKDYPDLPDPQAMFDICYFRRDPRPFFKFAKEIYPGQFQPSPSHRFIKVLESQDKLLRNYTQNIDTLEHAAGIENVITCHGSFATASCTLCHYKVDSSAIKEEIFKQSIPYCPECPADLEERGIMKPDIVFFGEGLSDEFHSCLATDKEICDLLIVIGSSLKVRPVAMIPSSVPMNVPQILINREPLKHLTFDIELLGDCDVIIGELCRRLQPEWTIKDIPCPTLTEINSSSKDSTSQLKDEINNNPLVSTSSKDNNDDSDFVSASSSMNKNDTDVSTSSKENKCDTAFPTSSEESNSCDYKGMSAINLDDSNEETPVKVKEDEVKNEGDKENKECEEVKQDTYLFVPPNRYIFPGAEINSKAYEDSDCSSTSTDYSSDSEDDSPGQLLPEEETDNSTSPLQFSSNHPQHSPSASPMYSDPSASPLNFQPSASPMYSSTSASPMYSGSSVSPMYSGCSASPLYSGSSVSPMYNGSSVSPMYPGSSASPKYPGMSPSPMYSSSSFSPMYPGSSVSPMYLGSSASPMYPVSFASPMYSGTSVSPMYSSTLPSPLHSDVVDPVSDNLALNSENRPKDENT